VPRAILIGVKARSNQVLADLQAIFCLIILTGLTLLLVNGIERLKKI